MQTEIDAKHGERIEVTIDGLAPEEEVVMAYCLDSSQRGLAQPWQPGQPPTYMPIDRALLLTGNNPSDIFTAPFDDTWLVVVDLHGEQQARVRKVARP